MAFPPVPAVPSGVRENTTPQVNTHPDDHTKIHQALSDIINELGANPSGDAPNLTAWLAILCPVGEIKIWGGTSAPSGWALCQGDAVSRVTYADLFAVIGTNFGAGDGGTTFNLPNLRGRSPLGVTTAGFGSVIGQFGGLPNTTLILHNHGGITPGGEGGVDHLHGPGTLRTDDPGNHSHNWGDGEIFWWYKPGQGGYNVVGGGDTMPATFHHDGAHSHAVNSGNTGAADRGLNHQHTIPNAGAGDGVDANYHPVTIVNYIIRLT